MGAAAGEAEAAGVGEVKGTVVQGTRISIAGGVAEGEADAMEDDVGDGEPKALVCGVVCWISTRIACGRVSGVDEESEEVPEVASAELNAQLVCQFVPS